MFDPQTAPSAPLSRRMMLKTTACGFGYLALTHMLADEARAAGLSGATSGLNPVAAGYRSPLAAKPPMFAPRAKRIIFMFMQGGPSHLDTFDYKPELASHDGKSGATVGGKKGRGTLLGPQFKFSRYGQSGMWISELFPNLAQHADELCMIHGCHTDTPAHPQATIAVHTGNSRFVRPSVGSWMLYGLGTVNQNLPGFITINPPARLGGAANYGAAFLPAAYQGTRIASASKGAAAQQLPNLSNRLLATGMQREQIDLIQSMNRSTLAHAGPDSQIDGVIQSYELAFRMQSAVPHVMDIADESDATREMYGISSSRGGRGNDFAMQCLLARRFAEAGVRYIEVCHTGWDQHNNLKKRLTDNCRDIDQPIAALLTDLRVRGLLDDTLVVWGGEFGRTAAGQGRDGRGHNNRGYTMWMAGGGVKGGLTYGATDALGTTAVADAMHTNDLHATMLHLMGLDHTKLTYRYSGRDFRLTNVAGNVATGLLA